jgi:hypothetical protein
VTVTKVLLVQGTHAFGRSGETVEWWNSRSPFCEFLQAEGFEILGAQQPYVWESGLDGTGWFGKAQRHIKWRAAAHNLHAYLRNPLVPVDYVPRADRNIIAHSHGLQVVAYACLYGLMVNRLVTVGSPVRADMSAVYEAARKNIQSWLHVYSDGSDRIQWYGTLFDGHVGILRKVKVADVNLKIPKVGHSRLLNDQACFPLWRENGLIDFLKGGNG